MIDVILVDEKDNNLERQKLNDQTKILTWMVIVFVVCQCFTIIGDAYDLFCALETSNCTPNIHIDNLIPLGHFMLAVNSSVNFIFYLIHINAFRQEFIKVKHFKRILKFMEEITLGIIYCKLLLFHCLWPKMPNVAPKNGVKEPKFEFWYYISI